MVVFRVQLKQVMLQGTRAVGYFVSRDSNRDQLLLDVLK